ncbi:MAG: hypothetical protein JSV19_08130 [Phycisphaerales bacterium]|nr:MAG: hypothetical protein JSV19_08130 [Phycisphaerales bacterium]
MTKNGNPLHAQGANYGYHGLHRLDSATYRTGTETFRYDCLGNRDGDDRPGLPGGPGAGGTDGHQRWRDLPPWRRPAHRRG